MFALTQQILDNEWTLTEQDTSALEPQEWDYSQPTPQVQDIRLWEVIDRVPGGYGVYAAHDPYVELYWIHSESKLFEDEVFYGRTAGERCAARAREWGSDIPVSMNWTTLYTTSREL
jgi:hypothetical protein